MPKIEINSCEHTANYIALEAVSIFMRDKSKANNYEHERVIHLRSGVSLKIVEVPMDVHNPTCSCSFTVTKIQEMNRID